MAKGEGAGAGRPSKYTEERARKIVDALKGGNTRKNSAAYAGVSYDTFREWEKAFPEFYESVEKAEADCEARNVAIIQKAAQGYDVKKVTVKTKTYEQTPKGGGPTIIITETETTEATAPEFCWQAGAWWLERRRPDEYKLRQATDVTSGGEQVAVIGFSINPPIGKQKEV